MLLSLYWEEYVFLNGHPEKYLENNLSIFFVTYLNSIGMYIIFKFKF